MNQTAHQSAGAKFSVEVTPTDQTRASAAGEAAAGKSPAKILLVEDERPFRELIAAFLKASGYLVQTVTDGREASRWLAANPADLVLTDLCMPESDGMELLMQMRKAHPHVPIIVMSGGVGGEMAGMLRTAELLGARRTLEKPFALKDLTEAVQSVLGPRG